MTSRLTGRAPRPDLNIFRPYSVVNGTTVLVRPVYPTAAGLLLANNFMGCYMQAETLLHSRLMEVSSYLHSNAIMAYSAFVSPSSRPLIEAGQAKCPLHGNVATIAARRFCVTSISTDCLIMGQATCPLCCNMTSSCLQRELLQETIRTHMFPSLSLVISSFPHHSAHSII